MISADMEKNGVAMEKIAQKAENQIIDTLAELLPCVLSKSQILQLIHRPEFNELVRDCFVRIRGCACLVEGGAEDGRRATRLPAEGTLLAKLSRVEDCEAVSHFEDNNIYHRKRFFLVHPAFGAHGFEAFLDTFLDDDEQPAEAELQSWLNADAKNMLPTNKMVKKKRLQLVPGFKSVTTAVGRKQHRLQNNENAKLWANQTKLSSHNQLLRIFFRRSRILKLIGRVENKVLLGCFVRFFYNVDSSVKCGLVQNDQEQKRSEYRIAQIVGLQPCEEYTVGLQILGQTLKLEWDKEIIDGRISSISDKPPTVEEFNAWLEQTQRSDPDRVPSVGFVESKSALIEEAEKQNETKNRQPIEVGVATVEEAKANEDEDEQVEEPEQPTSSSATAESGRPQRQAKLKHKYAIAAPAPKKQKQKDVQAKKRGSSTSEEPIKPWQQEMDELSAAVAEFAKVEAEQKIASTSKYADTEFYDDQLTEKDKLMLKIHGFQRVEVKVTNDWKEIVEQYNLNSVVEEMANQQQEEEEEEPGTSSSNNNIIDISGNNHIIAKCVQYSQRLPMSSFLAPLGLTSLAPSAEDDKEPRAADESSLPPSKRMRIAGSPVMVRQLAHYDMVAHRQVFMDECIIRTHPTPNAYAPEKQALVNFVTAKTGGEGGNADDGAKNCDSTAEITDDVPTTHQHVNGCEEDEEEAD